MALDDVCNDFFTLYVNTKEKKIGLIKISRFRAPVVYVANGLDDPNIDIIFSGL